MALSVSRRPLIENVRVRYQVSPYKIRGGGTRTGFGFCFSTCFPWSMSLHWCSRLIFIRTLVKLGRQKGEAWKPSKKQCSLGNRGALYSKVLSLFFFLIEGLSRLKNKSDVPNILLSASKKTHYAYVVLGEIITVYFQNYKKQKKKQHESSPGASVHYTEATCSTFLNLTPTLLPQLIKPFMENQGIQNTPYPELHKSQLHLSILSSHLCLMSMWIRHFSPRIYHGTNSCYMLLLIHP